MENRIGDSFCSLDTLNFSVCNEVANQIIYNIFVLVFFCVCRIPAVM
jgi:hypothetical protein